MATVWGAAKGNFRLGIDLIDNGSTFTWIVYGQSIAYGHNWNYTLSFSGTWGSGSKTGHFTSGYGETKTVELHRTTGSRVTSSNTATLTSALVSGATVSRGITVTPKPTAPRIDRVVRVSDSSHRVEWTRNATATSVRLERRTNGGAWQHMSSVSSNAANITDTTTKAGNRYQYRVRVSNAGGTSDWSNLSATVYTTPPVPSAVTATRAGDHIRVGGSVHANASHVDIQDDGTTVVSALAKASLPWIHSSPDQSETHRYRMRARVASGTSNATTLYSGWSSYSATVQLTAPPAEPTNLSPNGAVIEQGSSRALSWRHNPTDSSEQSAYELRYRVDGGAWTTLTGATASSRTVSFDAGVVEWQVRTKGAHPDWSAWSAVATVTVVDRPGVAILSPESGEFTEGSVTVSWSFFQAQGRPQSSWRARLLSGGQVVESREGTGDTSTVAFKARLEDDTSYTVEVEAATGGVWSDPDSVVLDVAFFLPAPAVLEGVWNDGTGAVDVQVSVLEQTPHPDVVNYAPPIVGDGTWAEVRRNRAIKPRATDASGGWSMDWGTGGAGEQTFHRDWGSINQPVTRSTCTVAPTAGLPRMQVNLNESDISVTPGETIRILIRVGCDVPVRVTADWRLGTTFVSNIGTPYETRAYALAEWVEWEITAPAGVDNMRLFVRPDPTQVVVGTRLVTGALMVGHGDYFDGSTPDFSIDPDMRQRWIGAENASESVMEIERVAGLGATAVIAGVSTKAGKPAARLIATDNSVNYSYASFPIPLEARERGTLLATSYLDAPLVGPISGKPATARPRDPDPSVGVPNEAGVYPQRVVYGPLTGNYRVELMHGGTVGSGDVWWTDIGLFAGNYTSDYFDGDTGWVEIDGTWMHTRWNSDGTSTASMPDTAVSMTVERSIDDGNTWTPVLVDESGLVQVADHEALSNGVTIYRVTTYAATGAATVREYPVSADSEAVWIGGGVGHAVTARLPYSPQITVTGGRERTMFRFSGRPKPVVYAGEGITRVVDSNGMILVDDAENTQPDDLILVAQNEEPTHLYRDPDGRHVTGMLTDIQVARQSHAHWAYSLQLEESED